MSMRDKFVGLEESQLCSQLQTVIKVIMDSICNGEVPSKYLYDKYILLSSLLGRGNPIIPNYLVYDKSELAKQLNGRVYGNHVEVDAVEDVSTKVDNSYLAQRIKSEITGWISEDEIKKRYNRSWLDILTLSALESDKAQDYLKEFVILNTLMGEPKLDEKEEFITIWISSYSNKMREALTGLYRKFISTEESGDEHLKFPVSYLFSR